MSRELERMRIDGFKETGAEIYGKNHHAATWGHDPVWGWFFGPMNITARMITFRDFQTYHVAQIGDTFNQRITYRTSVGNMVCKYSGDTSKAQSGAINWFEIQGRTPGLRNQSKLGKDH